MIAIWLVLKSIFILELINCIVNFFNSLGSHSAGGKGVTTCILSESLRRRQLKAPPNSTSRGCFGSLSIFHATIFIAPFKKHELQ
eukprot:3814124-Amphidinium_carterae.2